MLPSLASACTELVVKAPILNALSQASQNWYAVFQETKQHNLTTMMFMLYPSDHSCSCRACPYSEHDVSLRLPSNIAFFYLPSSFLFSRSYFESWQNGKAAKSRKKEELCGWQSSIVANFNPQFMLRSQPTLVRNHVDSVKWVQYIAVQKLARSFCQIQ